MNPLAKIPAVKIPGLSFQICDVSPAIAADWLKRNAKNRRMKEPTLESYTRDMRNDAWLLTHQGIAFDSDGNLIDGQHRLMSIMRSKKTVRLFVTAGWPNGKEKTMDAVDRGANRSLADQLHLQHGIPTTEAGQVVRIANSIAAACLGQVRVRKASTHTILSLFGLYRDEIKWALARPITQHGLKQTGVTAILILGRAVWPEKTSDFFTRLKTGENLASGNPVLSLRNWLIGSPYEDKRMIHLATAHHLHAFVEGRTCGSLVSHSNASLLHLLNLQKPRVDKIQKLYWTDSQEMEHPAKRAEDDDRPPSNILVKPQDVEGIALGVQLRDPFSVLDLSARLDGNGNQRAGQWLMIWRNKGWIETVGVNQFRKTKEFGR